MKTTWHNTWTNDQTYPSLSQDISVDVVIIGGGLTGILTAYLLGKVGKKVAVLEKKTLATSVTAYTTAFLTYDLDTNISDLIAMKNKGVAKEVWESHRQAIDTIETIVREENIDCDFMRCPLTVFAMRKKEVATIRQDESIAHDFGFNHVFHSDFELPFTNKGYSHIDSQAKFHPLKFADGVRKACKKYAVTFYEESEVIECIEKDLLVRTNEATVRARNIIIATYFPYKNPWSLFAQKGMYVSYVVELQIPKGSLSEGLYIDGANPYHYFRIDSGATSDRMILGGEDHREEVHMNPEKNYKALIHYAEHILKTKNITLITRWYGPILETIDGLAFIGTYNKKYPSCFVATGFSGNGITYAMIAGTLISEQILGRESAYAHLYNPHRWYSLTDIIIKTRDYLGAFIHGGVRNIFKNS